MMCQTLQAAVAHEPPLLVEGATFDYAVPQSWADDFHRVMGVQPVWIVWAYPTPRSLGEPYGVGPAAKALLQSYNILFGRVVL